MDSSTANMILLVTLIVITFAISIVEIAIAVTMLTLTRGLLVMFTTVRDGQKEQNNLLSYLIQLLRK